jgi:hypothetical protein
VRQRGTALVACTLLLAAGRAAADVAVRSEVDAQRVGVLDQVELTVTVEGAAVQLLEEVGLPTLKNLRVVDGPAVSNRFSLVNGAATQAHVSTWVLQPLAVGPAEVGAVRVRLAGGDRAAPSISLEVVAGSVKPKQPRRRDPLFGEDPLESMFGPSRPLPEPKLFLEASPSRSRLYVGEALVLTYYLYTQVSVTDFQFKDAPQYPGLWAEGLERAKAPAAGEPVTAGGEPYRRFAILEKLLFPTRAGTLTIPAASMRVRVTPRGFFDRGTVVERVIKPVTIEARPLPAEPGFSGAVGRFRVSATVDRPRLALGEAATLRFRVEGTGNHKWVDRAPEVAVPGAKTYPPQSRSDLAADRSGLTGSRTWEFVVVPETSGELEIPALPFTYFDPAAERIVRGETAAIPLRVEGGTATGASVAPAAGLAARQGGPAPLRAELDLPRGRLRSLGGPALAAAAGLTLLLHGAIWGLGRLGERRRPGSGRASRRSVRGALHSLERAGRAGLSKESAAALVEKAIHEAFGAIEDDGVPPEDEGERAARQILQEVNFIRYAPQLGDYSEKIHDLAARARELVRRWA